MYDFSNTALAIAEGQTFGIIENEFITLGQGTSFAVVAKQSDTPLKLFTFNNEEQTLDSNYDFQYTSDKELSKWETIQRVWSEEEALEWKVKTSFDIIMGKYAPQSVRSIIKNMSYGKDLIKPTGDSQISWGVNLDFLNETAIQVSGTDRLAVIEENPPESKDDFLIMELGENGYYQCTNPFTYTIENDDGMINFTGTGSIPDEIYILNIVDEEQTKYLQSQYSIVSPGGDNIVVSYINPDDGEILDNTIYSYTINSNQTNRTNSNIIVDVSNTRSTIVCKLPTGKYILEFFVDKDSPVIIDAGEENQLKDISGKVYNGRAIQPKSGVYYYAVLDLSTNNNITEIGFQSTIACELQIRRLFKYTDETVSSILNVLREYKEYEQPAGSTGVSIPVDVNTNGIERVTDNTTGDEITSEHYDYSNNTVTITSQYAPQTHEIEVITYIDKDKNKTLIDEITTLSTGTKYSFDWLYTPPEGELIKDPLSFEGFTDKNHLYNDKFICQMYTGNLSNNISILQR